MFDRAVSNFKLYLGLDMLMLIIFIFTGTITWLNHLVYFGHILLFALWYMTGFYLVIKPNTYLYGFLTRIGQKTLSIYVGQNVILCSFWLLEPILIDYGLMVNSLIFLGLQIMLLGIFVRFEDRANLKVMEIFWRKLASKL